MFIGGNDGEPLSLRNGFIYIIKGIYKVRILNSATYAWHLFIDGHVIRVAETHTLVELEGSSERQYVMINESELKVLMFLLDGWHFARQLDSQILSVGTIKPVTS